MADVGDSLSGGGEIDVPDGAWTVARLNEEIDFVLSAASDRFPTYVVGEVTEVNAYPFGTFFSLCDLAGEEVISCIAWSHAIDSFEHDLEAGTEAVVRASVDFYRDEGRCQLDVRGYWPLGESARSQDLAELRATLEENGLLADI